MQFKLPAKETVSIPVVSNDPIALFEREVAKFPPAKRELLKLVKFTQNNGEYVIEFHGSVTGAAKFVGNMRSYLSRIRGEAQSANRVIQHFKILTKSIEQKPGSKDVVLITLVKQKTEANRVSETLGLVLHEMVVGESS